VRIDIHATCHYNELTMEVVINEIYTAQWNHQRPEYIFIGEQGYKELSVLAAQGLEKPPEGKLLQFMGLHVVVLPTLPDRTLLLGALVVDPANVAIDMAEVMQMMGGEQ
jgi:hypothetical protein